MKRLTLLLLVLALSIMTLAACAAPAVEEVAEDEAVEEEMAEEEAAEEEVAEEEMAEEEAVEEEMAEEEMVEDELPYGLLPGKPYDGTEITFIVCCPTAAQFLVWEDSFAEFTELTGITVVPTWDPLGGLREKIVTESLGSPGSWDVTIWIDTWGPSLTNFIEPFDSLAEEAEIDLGVYPEVSLTSATYDDVLYGVPARSHVYMFFYRQDILDELGLEVPQTWDELEAAAATITEEYADEGTYGFTMNWGPQGGDQVTSPWMVMLRANGTDVFDEDFRPIFNNEAGIEATEFYASLLQYSPPGAATFLEPDKHTSLATGEAAMAFGWSWSYEISLNPEIADPVVTENMSFTSEIPGPDGPAVPIAMSWPMGISSGSNNKEAALEFIKWMSNPDLDLRGLVDRSDPSRSTVVAVQLPSLRDAEANEVNNGVSAVMADAYESAGTTNSTKPLMPEWPEVNSVLQAALTEIAAGGDVTTVLDNAAVEVEAIMERSGRYE